MVLLDDELRYLSKAILTVDQRGLYWLDKRRMLTPPEALRWYAYSMYAQATETGYTDLSLIPQCQRFGSEAYVLHPWGCAMRKKNPQPFRIKWDRNFRGYIEAYFAWCPRQGEWSWWYFTPNHMPVLNLERAAPQKWGRLLRLAARFFFGWIP